jgi:hypothetical protein
MSFNLQDEDKLIRRAIEAAFDAGIVSTVTAGNQYQPSGPERMCA